MEYSNESSVTAKYKFKDLRMYSSTEWMDGNRKKYRQVFDRYETGHIYAELALYNKLYDFEDWDVQIDFKCYVIKKGRVEIFSLQFSRKVSRFEPIFYLREGWGHKQEGSYWKKGTYCWEAYVDGEKVGSRFFYVEDAGTPITEHNNPYLEVKSVRLYEGPYEDTDEESRQYLQTFDVEETRYIYTEIELINLNASKSWQCELIVKFLNQAYELKGQVTRLTRVERKDDVIKVTAGWGHNMKGSWRQDNYKAVVTFFERPIAEIPFTVSDHFAAGTYEVEPINRFSTVGHFDKLSLEQVFARLDGYVGLTNIKRQIREHANYIRFLKLRKDRGFAEEEGINVHSVFIGNPGTGKTTIAKMMGALYHKMGLLSKGHVHEVDRVDLVGEYIGQTAPKVKAAIDKARGGVLFIDEAYSLARSQDDSKDFGREVIEILIKEMSNGPGDLVVIVAGYPKEMKYFLDSNPGLKSRFKYTYSFDDFTPDELFQILDYAAKLKEVTYSKAAKEQMHHIITDAYRNRNQTFGNARYVYDLVDLTKIALGQRVIQDVEDGVPGGSAAGLTRETLETIELIDVERTQASISQTRINLPIDEELLQDTLIELNSLVGLTEIKKQINELVQLVRYYRRTNRDVLNAFSLHTVLLGNPGTGKTTVARLLAKIYKALGLLERGHLVETDRQGLVAEFVGHTAVKTDARIEEAIKGVLFIDEAYGLTPAGGSSRDFGDEAIQTLLKRMEDRRGEFFVIVAGYTDRMEAFLKANPGLSSRFDQTLRFEDYSADELMEIAVQMLTKEQFIITEEAKEHLRRYCIFLFQYRDRYFGNARVVRQVIADVTKRHHLRMSALPSSGTDRLITLEDVKHLTEDKSAFNFGRQGVGFK